MFSSFPKVSSNHAVPLSPILRAGVPSRAQGQPMIAPETLLFASLMLPFVGSLVAACLPITARNTAAVLAGSLALAAAIITASLYASIAEGGIVRAQIHWLPSLGLSFVLRLDGLSWIFAILVLGIGVARRTLRALLYVARRIRFRASSLSSSPSWARCSAWCCRATSCSWSSSGS